MYRKSDEQESGLLEITLVRPKPVAFLHQNLHNLPWHFYFYSMTSVTQIGALNRVMLGNRQ